MRSLKFSTLLVAVWALISGVSTYAQVSSFSDPSVEYTFSLPDAKWKQTTKASAINPNVEYVYGERRDGQMEVRKLVVAKNSVLSDVIRDQEQKLQFLPGYVAGKEENFVGKLRGSVFNFEYVHSGAAMGGRYYFLRPNDTTVYVLRFSGEKESLRSIRNQTDQIARTFMVRAG
jgi:hypothetical protein